MLTSRDELYAWGFHVMLGFGFQESRMYINILLRRAVQRTFVLLLCTGAERLVCCYASCVFRQWLPNSIIERYEIHYVWI